MKPIKASTMSVILSDSTTVHSYISIGDEDCNVTLRFDRGARAVICGYPQTWDIHDVPVDQFDSESPTGADLYECDAIQDGRTYVSADDEREILCKLKRSIERQFGDCSWMDCSPSFRRQIEILNKINRAIEEVGRE